MLETIPFGCKSLGRRGARFASVLFVLCAAFGIADGQAVGREESDDSDQPRMLIVIFSPETNGTGQNLAQSVVWKSFVAELKKKKITNLSAINEVTLNENADRARVFEIARDQSKYTVWIEFLTARGNIGDGISAGKELTRLVARYTVFAPESNTIVGQGDIEQERAAESRFSTPNNEKVFRDNSGRVVNSRPAVRLPNGTSSNGTQMIDMDAYKRVGERVADRVIGAARKHSKGM